MFSATFALSFAYISDCVHHQDRAAAFGLALATFGLSYSVGPLIGAYLSQNYNSSIVFDLSLALTICNLLFISLLLPETQENDHNISMVSIHTNSICDYSICREMCLC